MLILSAMYCQWQQTPRILCTYHSSAWLVQCGKAEVYSARYVWNRVYFYAFLVFLRGIGEVAVGGIIHSNISSGR
jgi:hypothetical protein